MVDLLSLLKQIESMIREIGFLIVDNGSDDGTSALLHEFKRELSEIEILRIESNRLYGGGMKYAIENSKHHHLCLIPADNQYSAQDIVTCIEAYRVALESKKGASIVVGFRYHRDDPRLIQTMSYIYSKLATGLLDIPFIDVNGLPKVFDRRLIPAQILSRLPDNAVFDAALLSALNRNGVDFVPIQVSYAQRRTGQSSWSRGKFRVAFRMTRTLLKTRRTMRAL